MVNTRNNPFLFHLGPWLDFQRSLGEGVVSTLVENNRPPLTRGTLYRDESGATWVAQIPGLSASDLELTVDGRVLTLKTKVSSEAGEPTDFEQNLRMEFEVDGDQAQASIVHGLLLVRLPKKVAATVKRIEITGA